MAGFPTSMSWGDFHVRKVLVEEGQVAGVQFLPCLCSADLSLIGQ